MALNEDIKKAVRSLEMAEITHGVSMFCRPSENLILAKGGQIVWKICPIGMLNKLTKFLLNLSTFAQYEVFQGSAKHGNLMGDLCHF